MPDCPTVNSAPLTLTRANRFGEEVMHFYAYEAIVDGVPRRQGGGVWTDRPGCISRLMFDVYPDGVSPYGNSWRWDPTLDVDEGVWLKYGAITSRDAVQDGVA